MATSGGTIHPFQALDWLDHVNPWLDIVSKGGGETPLCHFVLASQTRDEACVDYSLSHFPIICGMPPSTIHSLARAKSGRRYLPKQQV
jgi:hypothetical protein